MLPTSEPDDWEVDYDSIVLGEEIGSGAFGTVWKASVSGLPGYPDQRNVVVAVKTLKGLSYLSACLFAFCLKKILHILCGFFFKLQLTH